MSRPSSHASPPSQLGLAPALWLVETTWLTWVGYASAVFTGMEGRPALLAAAGLGLTGGIASVVAGGPARRPWRGLLALALFAVLARTVAPALTPVYSWPAVAWLAAVAGCSGLFLRRPAGPLHAGGPRAGLAEAGRQVVLLVTATLLMLPFYTHRPIGAGDAHWYTLMLADFVAQIRAGIFPVWVGQTEYAFNGAVNPLRLAPWFQHFAGLLDLATAQSLAFIPLKNAALCVNFVLLGATAYTGLRRLAPAHPTGALALTMLLLASPAMLAPLYTGDQYMTFFALPFACVTVMGLAEVLEDDRPLHYLTLCIGLAGLWLAHSPIALWLSLLSALVVAGRLLRARSPGWAPRLIGAGVAFAILGTYPVISIIHLENMVALSAELTGQAAAQQVTGLFPGALLPLSGTLTEPTDYQPGYALLALALGAIIALRWRRSASALALVVALGVVTLLLLPVPAWAALVWHHLPLWLMKINGAWPQQRLVPIAAVLIAFLGALTLQAMVPVPSRRWCTALAASVLLALGWSGFQASGFLRSGWRHTGQGPNPALGFQTNNLSLTRYAFSSFATTPGYYTHGYINPLLEHRLLRADGSTLAANTRAAASAPIGTRVAAGTFTAVNDNNTAHYNLFPSVWLPGRQQLLLKLTPFEPAIRGWLWVSGDDVSREYILPDSGTAAARREPRAFGTLPGLSPYVPLLTRRPHGEAPRLTVILPEIGVRQPFDYAQYELWQFDPAQLPVAVRSWAPYRLVVNSPEPALVETPRAWLPGYFARLGDRRIPVQRSPDNLAMFPVPAGETRLVVGYAPPAVLAVSYWVTFGAWTLLLAFGLHALARRPA